MTISTTLVPGVGTSKTIVIPSATFYTREKKNTVFVSDPYCCAFCVDRFLVLNWCSIGCYSSLFVCFLAPRRARGNPCPHVFLKCFVYRFEPDYFGSSTFVGPVCDRHESVVYSEDAGTCYSSYCCTRYYTKIRYLVRDNCDISFTLLEPESRFGDKPFKFQVVYPQNGAAVLKG